MITKNIWVRDTLIRVEDLKKIPQERVNKINDLVDEFNKIGYIDARTEIGPNQRARMSDKQRYKISNVASRVFQIEIQIRNLLKTDEQLTTEAKEQRKKELNSKISQCESYLRLVYSMNHIRLKNGKYKKGYAMAIEDHENQIKEAKQELLKLN